MSRGVIDEVCLIKPSAKQAMRYHIWVGCFILTTPYDTFDK